MHGIFGPKSKAGREKIVNGTYDRTKKDPKIFLIFHPHSKKTTFNSSTIGIEIIMLASRSILHTALRCARSSSRAVTSTTVPSIFHNESSSSATAMNMGRSSLSSSWKHSSRTFVSPSQICSMPINLIEVGSI